jgi:hypothetical protein
MTEMQPLDTAAPREGTGAGMMGWFSWMIDKHEVTEANGASLRTGVRNVLTIDAEWRNADMRTVDVDQQIKRFRNARRGDLSEKSVEEYARRFRQSVESYRRWLADEKEWSPVARRATQTARRPQDQQPSPEPDVPRQAAAAPPDSHEELGLIRYTVPLRSGADAVIHLPRDLSAADARRIGRVVSSLAMDEDEDETGPTSPERIER